MLVSGEKGFSLSLGEKLKPVGRELELTIYVKPTRDLHSPRVCLT
jgi:hypothetical protein